MYIAKNNTNNIKGYTIEIITSVPSDPLSRDAPVSFLFIPPDILYVNHVYTSIINGCICVCAHGFEYLSV